MKKFRLLVFLGLVLSAVAVACAGQPPAVEEAEEGGGVEKTVYVGPTLVDCVGVAPQQCLQVKESPDEAYRLHYDPIEGFDYEEGYEYELRVREETVENPPADASAVRWVLIEVVSQTPVAGAGTAEAPPADATGTTEPATGGEGETADLTLENTQWGLVSFRNINGEQLNVLPDTEITALFEEGQVTGSAGCNNYFASYELSDSNLTVGPIGATQMACTPDEIMLQEAGYLNALQNAASFIIAEGNLVVTDAEEQVLLTFAPAELPALTGTTWQLTGYNNGQQAVVSPIVGTEITAVFDEDGRLAGNSGCNMYNTNYEAVDGSIVIGPAATTRMLCNEPEGVMEQEAAYLAALTTAATYTIRGDMLEMRTADDAIAATFVAAPAGTEAELMQPEAEAEAAPSLEGTLWQWQSLTTPVDVTEVGEPERYAIEFLPDGQLAIQADCNRATGTYTVDGESITISLGASTLAACPPDSLADQFLASLAAGSIYFFEGDNLFIDLVADGGTMMFAPAQQDNVARLQSGIWQWQAFTSPVEQFTLEDPAQYTLEFMPDGQVAIQADCNRAVGTYTADGSSLTFELGPVTLAQCAPESRSDQFLQNLQFVRIYFFEGDSLFMDMMADGGTLQFGQ